MMSSTTLHEIDTMWQDELFPPVLEDPSPVGGQRVTRFQGYLNQVDWTDHAQVTRALRVFEAALAWAFVPDSEFTPSIESMTRLRRLFARDGYTWTPSGEIVGGQHVVVSEALLSNLTDPQVIRDHLDRIDRAVSQDDPAQASEKGLAETAELARAGDRLSTHLVNITDRAAVEALPAEVIARHGAVDGVAHVAGIIHRFAPIADLSVEEIEKVVNVNYWGTVYVTKAFLPRLLKRPEASLVNFSGMGALVPVPGQGAYGSSKAAVKLFTETLVAELRDTNVAVTVVFPGGVSTNITGNSGVAVPTGAAKVDTSKIPTTTPQDAGRQTVEAIEKGTSRPRIGKDAVSLDRLARLNPVKAIGIIADRMKSILG